MSNLREINGILSKPCTKCGAVKPLDQFNKRKRNKDGHEFRCKTCSYEDMGEYRRKNPDLISKIDKKYREKNKEKRKITHKKWRDRTDYCKSEKFKETARRYRRTDKGRAYFKKYTREYFKTEKGRRIQRESRRKRMENDVNFAIAMTLRRRLRDALKYKGIKKTLSYDKLLGCSVEFFKNYIESMFTEGMNWGNHSYYGWHIDHVIPIYNFDLSNEEDQRKCFHYTNLQPLWATDNWEKGIKNLVA